jgi:hypothetical protein
MTKTAAFMAGSICSDPARVNLRLQNLRGGLLQCNWFSSANPSAPEKANFAAALPAHRLRAT